MTKSVYMSHDLMVAMTTDIFASALVDVDKLFLEPLGEPCLVLDQTYELFQVRFAIEILRRLEGPL